MISLVRRFTRIFRPARAAPPTIVPVPLPTGPIYAIGDIHGQLHQLQDLISRLWQDVTARGETRLCLAPLGDMIDRGPDSAGVIAWLCAPPPNIEVLPLCGNHEAMFLEFLAAPDAHASWLRMGGTQTLASYGLYPDRVASAGRHLSAMLDAHIPDAHRTFIKNLPLTRITQKHLLVHAGIDPTLPLDAQDAQTLLWIRKPFLEHDGPLERIVVHGHTPVDIPHLGRFRIGIDTGAGHGRALSAVRLEPGHAPVPFSVS